MVIIRRWLNRQLWLGLQAECFPRMIRSIQAIANVKYNPMWKYYRLVRLTVDLLLGFALVMPDVA